jgi:F0F1-type ATP synthase assembly protein I
MLNKINNSDRQFRQVGPYLGLGTQLAITIVGMFFLGYYLDNKWDIFPLLSIILGLFGGFAGIYNFIKTVLELNKKSKNIENK